MRAWFEVKGTVRIAIRTLALWEYYTEEQARQQLVKVIERETDATGPYVLQHAIDRRKKEIQWISIYIPFFLLSVESVLLVTSALFSHNLRNLYFCIAVVPCLGIIFRTTWFRQYIESSRLIYRAADALVKEKLGKIPVEIASTVSSGVFDSAQPSQVTPIPLSAISTIRELETVPPTAEIQAELQASAIPHAIPLEVEEDPITAAKPVKGSILLFLLEELIKQECKRPNIYSGEIHETVLLYSVISGCQPKNIISKIKYYKSRSSIALGSENARTTHLKYLEQLLHYFNAIGDDTLCKGVQNLHSFIGNLPLRKN